MRLNVQNKPKAFTHEGAPAISFLKPEQQLRRSVMACMLWEKSFYEDGQSIADRITETAMKCPPQAVAKLAIEARSEFNLRHVPLLLLDALTKIGSGSSLVADTIEAVIQRADELSEFLAVYWRDGKHPLSAQAKKGLARAFAKFDGYHLAKYNRDGAIKLRDVMFLVKPKPKDEAQAALYKNLADQELASPDTWEVSLSGGADKKETFERLLNEGHLGYMALLRNLRGMNDAGVDHELIKQAILARKGAKRVLPFRFIAAARVAPVFEPALDQAFLDGLNEGAVLDGKTVVLVDVSSSMSLSLSSKSDMTRVDAAAGLASMIIGANVRVFLFASEDKQYHGDGKGKLFWEVPYRLGMAGVDRIKSELGGGTRLGNAIGEVNKVGGDRLIVITDEQSQDPVVPPSAFSKAYMINVATDKNGVGYGGGWTAHISGFSEAVLRYVHEMENVQVS